MLSPAEKRLDRRAFLSRIGMAGAGAALLQGCAQMPGGQAAEGTPIAPIVRESFAALTSLEGLPLGSAVALDETHFITAAHVLPAGSGSFRLLHGDGLHDERAVLVGRSERADLALLRTRAGFARPAAIAQARPRSGAPVWAAGTPTLGAAVASGAVARPAVEVEGMGRGFTAKMPALMGYSGGPVVDASANLVGLTSAMLNPGGARLLAMLTGMDVDGLARPGEREVFVLGISAALDEARRLRG